MADIAFVEAQVAAIDPINSEIVPAIAAAAVTAGQAVYLDSNGEAALTDADAAASAVAMGIALQSVGANQAVDVLKRGPLYGFTITQAYGALLFVSVTAGAIADAQPAAGDFRFVVGRVGARTDKDRTKVLNIDIAYSQEPTAL